MLKRSLLLCGLAVLAISVSSCILDPPSGDGGTPPPPNQQKQELTTKSAVLNNIEVAYNKRQPDVYNELLGQGFTFFFSPGDVSGGGLPVQWDREDELGATTDLLLSNRQTPTPPAPVCRSVRMDIHFDNVQWLEVIPDQFPDETWYTTTLVYEFAFEMEPDQTYQSKPGSKAQFTVRNVPQNGKDHWQLVEFRDLGDGT